MTYNKPIRDPIHDYIDLTPIEQTIIDQPVFQRLRYILQNSSAYLTYPNNNSTRFMHSLGAMHIAGKYFIKSLENTDVKTLSSFLLKIDDIIEKKYGDDIEIDHKKAYEQWVEQVGNASKFNHHPKGGNCIKMYNKSESGDTYIISTDPFIEIKHNPLYLINILWQSVRLCALIHDIGHLPMSHIFEFAIDDVARIATNEKVEKFIEKEIIKRKNTFNKNVFKELGDNQKPSSRDLHELRGLSIFRKIHPNLDIALYRLVYKIAKDIFLFDDYALKVQNGDISKAILLCLHKIISSEIDCDRLDYCIRDHYDCGLELGAVDVYRIIDNVILINHNKSFEIAVQTKAQSAIESFFHQRYLEYKYLIYHHNVIRMDGIFRKIITILIEEIIEKNSTSYELRNILAEYSFYNKEKDKNGLYFIPESKFVIFDDYWIRTLFNALYQFLSIKKKNTRYLPYIHLHLLLDTFLNRKVSNVVSIWKRESDYKKYYPKIGINITKANRLKPFVITEKTDSKIFWDILSKQLDEIGRELIGEDVILIYRIMKPKIFESDKNKLINFFSNNGKLTASNISPYIKSLKSVAESTPNLHLSIVGEKIKEDKEKFEKCEKIICEGLSVYIKQIEEIINKKG